MQPTTHLSNAQPEPVHQPSISGLNQIHRLAESCIPSTYSSSQAFHASRAAQQAVQACFLIHSVLWQTICLETVLSAAVSCAGCSCALLSAMPGNYIDNERFACHIGPEVTTL